MGSGYEGYPADDFGVDSAGTMSQRELVPSADKADLKKAAIAAVNRCNSGATDTAL
jgi:hypothetical protein